MLCILDYELCSVHLNADVVFELQDGASGLHYATRSSNTFAIKALPRQKADVNACDNVIFCSRHLTYF